MLIIMGTSLKVHGLKRLVKEFSKAVHANASGASTSKARQHVGKVIFVNRTPPSAEWAGLIDYHISGETDVWVDRVIDDWKKMRPADWELQQTLVASTGENTMFKVTKPTALAMGKGKGKGQSACSYSRVHSKSYRLSLQITRSLLASRLRTCHLFVTLTCRCKVPSSFHRRPVLQASDGKELATIATLNRVLPSGIVERTILALKMPPKIACWMSTETKIC